MALLQPKTRKTQRGLPATPVLLGKVHAELVQDISCAVVARGNAKCGKRQRWMDQARVHRANTDDARNTHVSESVSSLLFANDCFQVAWNTGYTYKETLLHTSKVYLLPRLERACRLSRLFAKYSTRSVSGGSSPLSPSLKSAVQGAVTVHDDETEPLVVLEKLVQRLRIK